MRARICTVLTVSALIVGASVAVLAGETDGALGAVGAPVPADPPALAPATALATPDAPKPETPTVEAATAAWQPQIPQADEMDWLQLVSGEWLRGKLKRLRDETIEFESDKLDDLTLDMEDVAGFRLSRARIFVLEDRAEIVGRGVMKDGEIVVWTDAGERRFSRARLLSIVPTGDRRIDLWDGKASIGVSSSSGNTDEQDMSTYGYLRRATSFTRLRFDYNGNISIVGGATNANTHRGTVKFDVFLSQRWYFTPAMLDVYTDELQNIALRLTPSAALGYHIFNTPKIEWEVELGAGAQITRADRVPLDDNGQPLEDRQDVLGSIIPATRVEWEITDKIDWDFSYRMQLGVPKTDQRFHNLFSVLSIELTKIIDIDISLKFDRSANPPPNADGTTPKQNDVTVSFGFGLDF